MTDQPPPAPPSSNPGSPAPGSPATGSPATGAGGPQDPPAGAVTSSTPPPPATPPATGPTVPWPTRVRDTVGGWLRGLGVGARVLGISAAAAGLLAALLLALGHAGLGGIVGLLALVAAELAETPGPEGRPEAYAAAWTALLPYLVAGGLAGEAAKRAATAGTLLALLALVFLAWLPDLRPRTTDGGTDPGPRLWHRAEHLLVLLMGAILGRPSLGVLVVVLVASLDAWLRLGVLRAGPGEADKLGALTDDHGRLHPVVRIGSLALVILLMLVLPVADGWRF